DQPPHSRTAHHRSQRHVGGPLPTARERRDAQDGRHPRRTLAGGHHGRRARPGGRHHHHDLGLRRRVLDDPGGLAGRVHVPDHAVAPHARDHVGDAGVEPTHRAGHLRARAEPPARGPGQAHGRGVAGADDPRAGRRRGSRRSRRPGSHGRRRLVEPRRHRPRVDALPPAGLLPDGVRPRHGLLEHSRRHRRLLHRRPGPAPGRLRDGLLPAQLGPRRRAVAGPGLRGRGLPRADARGPQRHAGAGRRPDPDHLRALGGAAVRHRVAAHPAHRAQV
ncbi:MAG: hypothetical protein AVDCRST_MAG60-2097, partial [uncultured Nocardioides sp.]